MILDVVILDDYSPSKFLYRTYVGIKLRAHKRGLINRKGR